VNCSDFKVGFSQRGSRDRRKLTFYFIADKRIDFRELVRELFRYGSDLTEREMRLLIRDRFRVSRRESGSLLSRRAEIMSNENVPCRTMVWYFDVDRRKDLNLISDPFQCELADILSISSSSFFVYHQRIASPDLFFFVSFWIVGWGGIFFIYVAPAANVCVCIINVLHTGTDIYMYDDATTDPRYAGGEPNSMARCPRKKGRGVRGALD